MSYMPHACPGLFSLVLAIDSILSYIRAPSGVRAGYTTVSAD